MESTSFAGAPPRYRNAPPAWVLGLATLCNGAFSGILIITVPQLLAARGVPELQIASVLSLSFVPGVFNFLAAPILDVGLSRRVYAIALAIGLAALTALSLNLSSDIPKLAVIMFLANICYYLYTPAIAGWFGQLVARNEEPVLGAWMSAASVAGFGCASAAGILLLRNLPFELGVAVICLLGLAPLSLFFFVPHEPTPTLSFRGSFGPVTRNLARIVRDRHVWRMMALFAAPCATFSLTNTLSGVGRDFHASEAFVGLVGGVGATLGGVFGGLGRASVGQTLPASSPLHRHWLTGSFFHPSPAHARPHAGAIRLSYGWGKRVPIGRVRLDLRSGAAVHRPKQPYRVHTVRADQRRLYRSDRLHAGSRRPRL